MTSHTCSAGDSVVRGSTDKYKQKHVKLIQISISQQEIKFLPFSDWISDWK